MPVAPEILQQLIDECQGLVRSLALGVHRSLPQSVELDDLVAYGQIGLVEAARSFDPARGNRFSTFAYYRIRGAIYDGMAKMSWFGRSGSAQAHSNRLSNEVLRGEAEGEETPEAQTESSKGDQAERDVRWLRRVTRALAVVHFATRGSEDRDGSAAEPADESAVAGPTAAIQREVYEKLNKLVDGLPTQAAKLIRATYFEGLTLQEAGQRLGMSKSWASRLHAKALQLLAESLRLQGISA
jgi:RNA polymerase sigma factor FliA